MCHWGQTQVFLQRGTFEDSRRNADVMSIPRHLPGVEQGPPQAISSLMLLKTRGQVI